MPDLEVPSNENPSSLLLVFLTKLSLSDENRLIAHLQPPQSDFSIKTWSPDDHLLRSIAPQGQYRDSQANLYALAIWLYRTGRTYFIVADDLTKRQVEGETVRGEKKEISVVKLGIRASARGGVRVIARRSAMASDENIALLEAVKNFEINPLFLAKDDGSKLPIFNENGFELHDPDNRFFADANGSLGHEEISRRIERELSATTPLPAELVLEIASRASDRASGPFDIPSDLNLKKNINVFLAFRTSEEECTKLQSSLQEAVHVEFERQKNEKKNEYQESGDDNSETEKEKEPTEPKVCLIPWKDDRPLSRRDAMRIHAALNSSLYPTKRHNPCRSMDILLEPVKNISVNDAPFATIFYPPGSLAVTRSTLKDLVNEVGSPSKCGKFDQFRTDVEQGILQDSDTLEVIPSEEIFSSYDGPFYPNPPPWQPIDRVMRHISLFYMTNQLTKEENRAICSEIEASCDDDNEEWGEKVICPVYWKPGQGITEDAPLEYMLQVYEQIPQTSFCGLPYFFVDQQSSVDKKIVVMEEDFFWYEKDDEKACELLQNFPEPNFRGLRYARCPGRNAHIVYDSLSIGNMDMEEFEFEGGVMKFPRPGWPGHGILFNEEELEAMEEEEEQNQENNGNEEGEES